MSDEAPKFGNTRPCGCATCPKHGFRSYITFIVVWVALMTTMLVLWASLAVSPARADEQRGTFGENARTESESPSSFEKKPRRERHCFEVNCRIREIKGDECTFENPCRTFTVCDTFCVRGRFKK